MSMRSSCSPTRPLSQHSPHLFHSTELQGRTAKRAYHDNSTLGKWENLIGKGEIQTPVKRNNNASFNQSPRKAQNDSYQPVAAGRPTSAVSPSSFFDNSSQPESSSKVSTSDYYAGRPSKWGNQMNRTLCVDTTQQGGIRVFRDREESPFEKTADKRPLVAYSPTQNTWNSHISVLPCTTYTKPRIAMASSPEAARRRQIQSPLMVHPENIKFEAEERSSMRALTADQKERKEVHKTYVRCVNMTAKDEVSNVVVNQGKRDHNKQSHASFLADEGRLNPNTRGKRMNSPDYIKRESAMEAEKFMVQPLNKMTKGKKFEYRSLSGYIPPPKPASVETCTGKAKTFFSYRNFASQFNLKHNS